MKKSIDLKSQPKQELTPKTNSIYFDCLYVSNELWELYKEDIAKIYNNESKNGTHFEQIGDNYQCKDYEFTVHTSRLDNGDRLGSVKLQFDVDGKMITLLIPRKNIKHNYNDACMKERNNILFISKYLDIFREMARNARNQNVDEKKSEKKKQTIFNYDTIPPQKDTFILSDEQAEKLITLTFVEIAALFGAAGAGKTHIGIRLMEQYFINKPDCTKTLIYLVSQQQVRLKSQVQGYWEDKWHGNPPGQVLFLTDQELMLMYLSEVLNIPVENITQQVSFQDKKHFCDWYNEKKSELLKAYNNSSGVNGKNPDIEKIKDHPYTIYDIITSVAGLSEKDFVDLGDKRYAYDKPCRELLYKILDQRRIYCDSKQIIDLRICKITKDTWIKKFGMLVFDEFQNVGLQQLIDASKIADKVVYCGDGHQTLENKAATIQNLLTWFEVNGKKPSIQKLTETFRNPPEITALANHCFRGKRLTNGHFHKYEVNTIATAAESPQKKGNVCYLHAPGKEVLADFAKMTTNHARGVIVLYEREFENAKKMFPMEEGIYTVNQIHGTEFDHVYIYISLSRMKDIIAALERSNAGKADASDWNNIMYFWNAMTLCITRAKILVCIINPDPASTKNALSQYFSEAILEGRPIAKHWTGENIKESTREELLERVKDIASVDMSKALDYFLSCKLGSEVDFHLLCRQAGIIGNSTLDLMGLASPKPTEIEKSNVKLQKALTVKKSDNKNLASYIASVYENFTFDNVIELFDKGFENELLFGRQSPKCFNLISILQDEVKCRVLEEILCCDQYINKIDGEKFCRSIITLDQQIFQKSRAITSIIQTFLLMHPQGVKYYFTKYSPDAMQTGPKSKGNRRGKSSNQIVKKISVSEFLVKSDIGCKILLMHCSRAPYQFILSMTAEWLTSTIQDICLFPYGHILLNNSCAQSVTLCDLFTSEILSIGQKNGSTIMQKLVHSLSGLNFIEKIFHINNKKILKALSLEFLDQKVESTGYTLKQALSSTDIGVRILATIQDYLNANLKRKNTAIQLYTDPAFNPVDACSYYQNMLEFMTDAHEIRKALFEEGITCNETYSCIFDLMYSRPGSRSFLLDYYKRNPQLTHLFKEHIKHIVNSPAVISQVGQEFVQLLHPEFLKNDTLPKSIISLPLRESEKLMDMESSNIEKRIRTERNLLLDLRDANPPKLPEKTINWLIPCLSNDNLKQQLQVIFQHDNYESFFFDSLSDSPHDCFMGRILNDEIKYEIFSIYMKENGKTEKLITQQMLVFLANFKPWPNIRKHIFVDFALLLFDYAKFGDSIFSTDGITFAENHHVSLLELLFRHHDFESLFRYILSIQKNLNRDLLLNFIANFKELWYTKNKVFFASLVEDGSIEEILFHNFRQKTTNSGTSLFELLTRFQWGNQALQSYFEKRGKQSIYCRGFLETGLSLDSCFIAEICSTPSGHRLLLTILKSRILISDRAHQALSITPSLALSPDGVDCLHEIMTINKINHSFICWDSVLLNGFAPWHLAHFTQSGNKLLPYMKGKKSVWSKEQDHLVEMLFLCFRWLYFETPDERYKMLTAKNIFCMGKHETMLDFLLSTTQGSNELMHFLENHVEIVRTFDPLEVIKPLKTILKDERNYSPGVSDIFQERFLLNGFPDRILRFICENWDLKEKIIEFLITNPFIDIYRENAEPGFFKSKQTIDPAELCYQCHVYLNTPIVGGPRLVSGFIHSLFDAKSISKTFAAEKMLFEKFTLHYKVGNSEYIRHNQTIFGWLTRYDWGCDLLLHIVKSNFIGYIEDPVKDPDFLTQISGNTLIYMNLCAHPSGQDLLQIFNKKFGKWLNPISEELFLQGKISYYNENRHNRAGVQRASIVIPIPEDDDSDMSIDEKPIDENTSKFS